MRSHILSRYEILGTLGRGGMGEVLKARDLQLKRLVAIKRLLSGSLGDAEAKGRFLREARLAAQLSHPGIATIYDIFEAEEETFIVMEYVEGETLRERVARGPLPLKEALALGRQIAAALSAAHHQGVIHRDIKLENIKVMSDGRAKVLDFGLAKQIPPMDSTMEETVQAESVWLTRQGFAGGTPGYTAPEQWKGAPADARADIFSLGVVLYEMITGETPFPGKTVVDRITATIYVDPAPVTRYANAPVQMEPVIRKALAKDPRQRFQSMDELLAALEQIEEATAVAPSGWSWRPFEGMKLRICRVPSPCHTPCSSKRVLGVTSRRREPFTGGASSIEHVSGVTMALFTTGTRPSLLLVPIVIPSIEAEHSSPGFQIGTVHNVMPVSSSQRHSLMPLNACSRSIVSNVVLRISRSIIRSSPSCAWGIAIEPE